MEKADRNEGQGVGGQGVSWAKSEIPLQPGKEQNVPKALSIRFAKTGFQDPQVLDFLRETTKSGFLRRRFPTDGRRGSAQARFPNKGLQTTRFPTKHSF